MNITNTNDMIKTSFKILKEMLVDRNEDISNIENITEEELYVFFNKNQIFDIDVNDKLKVIYHLSNKIKIQDIRKFIDVDLDKSKTIIFISKEKLTTNNFKTFNDFKAVNLQFFYIKELLFNIYRHNLVPKHEIITDKNEIEKLMKKYLLKNRHQFPLIMHTDPVCKYLNIKVNSLVKITRPSVTSGEYILYRYVI